MWKTVEEMGLIPTQIDEIISKLWDEENRQKAKHCPDCGVEPGKKHEDNCDVACCLTCGMQALQCSEHNNSDTWTGLWPGIKECYDNAWIVYNTGSEKWSFDLNKAAVERQIKAKTMPQIVNMSCSEILTEYLKGKKMREDVEYYNSTICETRYSKKELVKITEVELFDNGEYTIRGTIVGGKLDGFNCNFGISLEKQLDFEE